MATILSLVVQIAFFILLAPLVTGCIRKAKNWLRMRRGPGILQPYYHIMKLWVKEEVVSRDASWLFRAVPIIVFAAVIVASSVVPLVTTGAAPLPGDLFFLIFMLGAGRFFLALAGLDAGSSFGGMGSSREMFISALAEPVAFLAIFIVALPAASTLPAAVAAAHTVTFSTLLAAGSFVAVMLAETSRIPVDNQETHLELTMIHEAMILEYSGRSLALIELAAQVKQLVLYAVIAHVIVPLPVMTVPGPLGLAAQAVVALGKIAGIACGVSLLEVSVAKMRLFRAVDFLTFALALAVIALVGTCLGW